MITTHAPPQPGVSPLSRRRRLSANPRQPANPPKDLNVYAEWSLIGFFFGFYSL
jgi:hypothetical protein